jgi:hypothetical protein
VYKEIKKNSNCRIPYNTEHQNQEMIGWIDCSHGMLLVIEPIDFFATSEEFFYFAE